MIELSRIIKAFSALGDYILSQPEELNAIKSIAQQHNGWFDLESQETALTTIANEYLNKEKLEKFTNKYSFSNKPKKVAIIMAGNIPLVGFHDLLCVLLSGHNALVKLASKDNKLMRALLMKLIQLEPELSSKITISESYIREFEAVIATGSDSSATYFEEYFGSYPSIIRKNRNSLAIITGKETEEDFRSLGQDIFQFYGLGCRNVSKLFVPKDYDFSPLLTVLNEFSFIANNTKYKNNFDYNLTLLILNKIPYLENDCLIVTEDSTLHSRIGTLHYQEYNSMDEVNNWIIGHKDQLQVIVGKEFTPFGSAQTPSVTDFADNIDTMKFLNEL